MGNFFRFLLLIIAVLPLSAPAFESDEHRHISDAAFTAVFAENRLGFSALSPAGDGGLMFNIPEGATEAALLKFPAGLFADFPGAARGPYSFGEVNRGFSLEDIARARCQAPRRSIYQQLQPLTAQIIETVWRKAAGGDSRNDVRSWPLVRQFEQPQNAVVNYLLHHLVALRFAGLAAEVGKNHREVLLRALAYEAIAQGYLVDAFSSAHLLLPLQDFLSGWHPLNNRAAHDFYAAEGLFVCNGRGEVWQAFGDRLLQWYAPTYDRVLEACKTSLREVLLVFLVSENRPLPGKLADWAASLPDGQPPQDGVAGWLKTRAGEHYLDDIRLPTLLLLPMPVSATWSIRTAQTDRHGIRQRLHRPQLREAEWHDPGLPEINARFLYPKAAFPDWMIPDKLRRASPEQLIREDKDVASVWYVQEWDYPPTYRGLLFRAGGGPAFNRGSGVGAAQLGVGYGLIDAMLMVENVSLGVELVRLAGGEDRLLLGPVGGLSLNPAGFHLEMPALLRWINSFRGEIGYLWGMRESFKEQGIQLSLGIETAPLPLRFTYVATTVQLKYQLLSLNSAFHGPVLELVLH